MPQVSEPESEVGRDDFYAVSVAMLIPSKVMGISLYTRAKGDKSVRLFRGPEFPFTEEDIKRLNEQGTTKLFVAAEEHAKFQQYLRDNLDDVLADESLSVGRRFANLNEVLRNVLSEAFRQGNIEHTIEQTQELGEKAVELICRDDVVASELCDVLCHDYHTFTHSANVAYYCVMLANGLSISDSEQLNEIASGALLHDVGKLEIPDSILTKPGKLTDEEFGIIKGHPTIGFRKLCHREDISFGQLMMVYQHHERMDGNGYPVRAEGKEIHHWARICAVVDVFEALTSSRPYRRGLSQTEAFNIMDRQIDSGFDSEVYRCWKEIISNR